MPKKTTEQFIKEATAVHGDAYDYSKTEYKGHREKVEIICPKHGSFWQRPDVHVSQMSGCPICFGRGHTKDHMTSDEKFWDKVNKDGPQIEYMDTPCWQWEAGTMPSGYGGFRVGETTIGAHIYSYELHNGPVPTSENGHRMYHVIHACDNKRCVNPDHLSLGDDYDNMSDAAKKGRLSHKLRRKDIGLIRKLYKTGKMSHAEIGRIFGVSAAAIGHAVNRRTWKHVE